jgi:hypothetical protein
MDPLVALRPLAQLQQSIYTISQLNALALSSLRRAPAAGPPPPPQDNLQWLISLGLARDGQQDKWWQAQLDLAAVEKILTVRTLESCTASLPSAKPKSKGKLTICIGAGRELRDSPH